MSTYNQRCLTRQQPIHQLSNQWQQEIKGISHTVHTHTIHIFTFSYVWGHDKHECSQHQMKKKRTPVSITVSSWLEWYTMLRTVPSLHQSSSSLSPNTSLSLLWHINLPVNPCWGAGGVQAGGALTTGRTDRGPTKVTQTSSAWDRFCGSIRLMFSTVPSPTSDSVLHIRLHAETYKNLVP